MNPKHRPPRWFSTLVFLCGLYVFIYLAATEGSTLAWLPTGAVALMMMAEGIWWFFRGARPLL